MNKKKKLMESNPSRFTEEKAEMAIARQYGQFAERMARRALMKKGHFILWAKATIEDEFIEVVILPSLTFIIAKLLK